jgi:2-polyprenyl-6-methoxyphenol hydroxylase-like FAD-dependent oxidoreductase
VRALIVGGGIGGLAAAVALGRVGIDSLVLERAAALDPLGAGLVLSANAVRALDRIGVGEAVRARSARGNTMLVRSPNGSTLLKVELENDLETLGIHRADLQQVLLDAAGTRFRLGARVTEVLAVDEPIRVRLEDGAIEDGDLLIGADGVNSVVRSHLLGSADPEFSLYLGWRAVVDYDDELVRGRFSETWGRGERFGLVPIGGGRLYWFVAERAEHPDVNRTGIHEAFRRRFREWHDPIPAVVERTPESAIVGTAIFDRKPAQTWGRGRATLLGDAAHPMTPNLGQGAAQALEDAVVLAARLRDGDDPEESLRAYERERIRRTTPIVTRSRQLGRIAQARGPVAARLRNALFRALPAGMQTRQQRAILDYELPEL